MSLSDPREDALRRRLLHELSRGEEAELAPVLADLAVRIEPPAHLDAQILASVPDAAGPAKPSARVDRIILAASERAVAGRERRGVLLPFRRRVATAVAAGSVVALAAGVALVVVARGHRDGAEQAVVSDSATKGSPDQELRRTVDLLAENVSARYGRQIAEPVRAEYQPPTAEPPTRPTAVRSSGWTPADEDRFAGGLLEWTARLQAHGNPQVEHELEPLLVHARQRCRDGGRCFGLISLKAGELALARGDRTLAGQYASDAARSDDDEVRGRARELAVRVAGTPPR